MTKSTKIFSIVITALTVVIVGLLQVPTVQAVLTTTPWFYDSVPNVVYTYPNQNVLVGIGTTSPATGAKLAVGGKVFIGSAATSTNTQGWNLTAGCYAINDVCIGGSSAPVSTGKTISGYFSTSSVQGAGITYYMTTTTTAVNIAAIEVWATCPYNSGGAQQYTISINTSQGTSTIGYLGGAGSGVKIMTGHGLYVPTTTITSATLTITDTGGGYPVTAECNANGFPWSMFWNVFSN